MAIEITKAGSIPQWAKGRRGRPSAYPFDALEIGGTFVVLKEDQSSVLRSFRVTVSVAGKRLGKSFRCRQREDGAIEVVRIK